MNNPTARVALACVLLAIIGLPPRQSHAKVVEAPPTAALFLELEGIAGESQDPQHKGLIEIQSFNWSARHPGPEGDKPGKANLQDFFVLKPVDAVSPKLMLACTSGAKIGKAAVIVRGGKEPREFVKYTFTDVAVSAVSHVVSNIAQEQLNFRYGSVRVEYVTADGKTVGETFEAKADAATAK